MSTITTINSSDLISNSRTDINTNFSNLNTDKIETSTLDTDTALAANSDAKIATQKAVKAYVDAGGNVNASETTRGIVEEATDAEVTAGTATGGTGAKLFTTPAKLLTYLTAFITTNITPINNALAKFIGVGQSSNTTYENYQILYGIANTVWNWTSVGTPTYSVTHLLVGSAQGAFRSMPIDMGTGATYLWDNTKIKIIEWDATIVADVATAISYMGFSSDTISNVDAVASNRRGIGFITDTNGAWGIFRGNGTNTTVTSISTPSAAKHTFRIEYNPVTPLATFYIDGVSVGTHSANLPNDANAIGLSFSNGTTSTIISRVTGINLAIQK